MTPTEQHIKNLNGQIKALRKQLELTRRRMFCLEAREKIREAGKEPRHPVEFRSQYGEDQLLFDAFAGRTEGFIIEVGAFDGYRFSVSYALECMGWDSLLIEAIPERVEEARRRRPHARVVHAALGPEGSTGETEFTVVDDHWDGMLSYHQTTERHKAAIARNQQASRTVKVPFTTMNELLADHTGPIHAAVIDVEGGEVDLLRGFDLERFQPEVLLIEDNSRGDDSPVGKFMRDFPYKMIGWLSVNRIYVREDRPEIISRFKG